MYSYANASVDKVREQGQMLWQKTIDQAKNDARVAIQKEKLKEEKKEEVAKKLMEQTPAQWVNKMVDNRVKQVVKKSAVVGGKGKGKDTVIVDYDKIVAEKPQNEEEMKS